MKNLFKDQLSAINATKNDKFNVRCLCISTAFAEFCAAMSVPVTYKWTVSCPEVTPQLLSISEVVYGVTLILICRFWFKGSPVRNLVWKYREFLNIGDLVTTTACVVWMFIAPNPYLLFIIHAMIFWFFFSSWFGRILDFTKAKLFNRAELRNSYDTMADMYNNIASTSGYIIGIFISNDMPLEVAFVFWQTGVAVRVLGRAYVFAKNRKVLSNVYDEEPDEEDELAELRAENERLKREIAELTDQKA
ncbi:MAG: hypothetical protein MJZ27_08630 [Bacteroidales bacterium]|nr:hypothetical protein [Bacteroidales bacterium]